MQHVPRRRSGFTLIEIMIVVVILGILASTVLPQFTMSQESAKEAAMVTSLNTLRTQIQLYILQHNGRKPTAATDLTTATDVTGGTTGSPKFGPYVIGQIPANPLYSGTVIGAERTIKFGTPDNNSGWAYDATTNQFSPGNTPGDSAPSGKLYSEF